MKTIRPQYAVLVKRYPIEVVTIVHCAKLKYTLCKQRSEWPVQYYANIDDFRFISICLFEPISIFRSVFIASKVFIPPSTSIAAIFRSVSILFSLCDWRIRWIFIRLDIAIHYGHKSWYLVIERGNCKKFVMRTESYNALVMSWYCLSLNRLHSLLVFLSSPSILSSYRFYEFSMKYSITKLHLHILLWYTETDRNGVSWTHNINETTLLITCVT